MPTLTDEAVAETTSAPAAGHTSLPDEALRGDDQSAGNESRESRGWYARFRSQHRPPGTRIQVPGDLDVVLPLAPKQTQELSRLYLRTQQVLWSTGLGYAMRLIEDAIANAAVLARAGATAEAVQQLLADDVAKATDFVNCTEGENARRRYSRGLLNGVALSVVVLVLIALASEWVITHFMALAPGDHAHGIPLSNYFALRDVLVCVGGGAAGAAVSVLLRLSHETDLHYKTVANGAALYRIALGWFFAAALMFLVKGALTTLFTDPTAAVFTSGPKGRTVDDARSVSSWFFWGGIGFLAGFNERWATHIISKDPEKAADPKT